MGQALWYVLYVDSFSSLGEVAAVPIPYSTPHFWENWGLNSGTQAY
jgi:hypothetical protein